MIAQAIFLLICCLLYKQGNLSSYYYAVIIAQSFLILSSQYLFYYSLFFILIYFLSLFFIYYSHYSIFITLSILQFKMAIGIFTWNLALPNIGVSALCRANDNAQATASGRNVCNTTQHQKQWRSCWRDCFVWLTTVKGRPRRGHGVYSEFRFMVFDVHWRVVMRFIRSISRILWYSDLLHNTTSAGNSIFVTNHNTTTGGRSIM